MSNFLAVDTSSRSLTVVACRGNKKVVRHLDDCAMKHSVLLMDEIDLALAEAGLTPKDCDFFCAVTGPGSFTGIRIGVACVKGYATALSKRAFGVTAFEMLSYNVNSNLPYLVCIDAGHGNYYACGYSGEGNGECDIQPRYMSGEEVINSGRPVFGYEDLPLPAYTKLSAKDCLLPAVTALKDRADGVTALYVKKSQAEEEREARLKKK